MCLSMLNKRNHPSAEHYLTKLLIYPSVLQECKNPGLMYLYPVRKQEKKSADIPIKTTYNPPPPPGSLGPFHNKVPSSYKMRAPEVYFTMKVKG